MKAAQSNRLILFKTLKKLETRQGKPVKKYSIFWALSQRLRFEEFEKAFRQLEESGAFVRILNGYNTDSFSDKQVGLDEFFWGFDD